MNVRSLFTLVTLAVTVVSSRARADNLTIEPLPHAEVAVPAQPIAAPTSDTPGPAPEVPAAAPPAEAIAGSAPAPLPALSEPATSAIQAPHDPPTLDAPAVSVTSDLARAVDARRSPLPTVASVSATPAPAAPVRPRMGWFGVGLRVGSSSLRLAPSAALVNQVNQASGGTFTPGDFAVDSTVRTVTPTFHFGGTGYFFKLEVPFGFGPAFSTFGLGLYPVNVGFFIKPASLFPYVSFGGSASGVKSRTTADPGTSNKLIGAIVAARAAVGAKYFPVRGLALSAEIGYAPWAAGIMAVPPSAAPGTGSDDATKMQGGTGSILDVSIGAEWL